MILTSLLADLKDAQVFGNNQVEINNLTDDSRKVTPGSLFVAVKGIRVDAHDLILQAIEAGAVAVIGERNIEDLSLQGDALNKITYIKVENSRHALGIIASTWYGNPSHKLKVIGVTGTEGKTTTCSLIYHILEATGHSVGLISTIGAKIGKESTDTGLHVTNPEAMQLQELLSKIVDNWCEFAVIEVTSQGLDQDRISGVKFDTGVLTNIRQDHLDYHGSLDNYREAKAKLFRMSKKCVINFDDLDSWNFLIQDENMSDWVDYGMTENLDDTKGKPYYKATDIKSSSNGTEFTLQYLKDPNVATIKTNLIGKFNVSNILAAIATIHHSYALSFSEISKSLESFETPTGRLEKIDEDQNFSVFVDFAHTPGALESVLSTLKEVTPKGKKLIAVYGAAGERDASKRPAMGRAARHADLTIFTTDDPRSEDPKDIISEMEIGAKEVGANYNIVIDRTEAIKTAIEMAKEGDIVVLCGKGHEKSMAIKGEEIPWSDQEVVRRVLRQIRSTKSEIRNNI